MTNDTISKVILITGGARRIGRAIIKDLHQQGYQIILHYKQSQSQAQELAKQLNKQRPDSVQLLPAALENVAKIPQFIQAAYRCWGRLDALINNASVFYATPLSSELDQAWDSLMTINAKVPLLLAQASWPYLKSVQGCVINLLDTHSLKPLGDYSVYSVSKAALRMVTLALAKEWAPAVRVNAVAPGVMLWPEGSNALSLQAQQAVTANIPLQRIGQPHDIARAVSYLLTASYVTGHVLVVDGGRSAC